MATIVRYVNPGSSGGDGTTSALTGANAAYASLNAWEAAEQTDLDTANNIMQVNCAGTTADTTLCTITGWTTSATDYIEIVGDNTTGKESPASTYYVMTPSATLAAGAAVLNISQANVIVDKIEIKGWEGTTDSQYTYGIAIGNFGNVTIRRCIIHDPGTINYRYKTGILNNAATSGNVNYIYRNIIYNLNNNWRNQGINSVGNVSGTGAIIYNNTCYEINGSNIGVGLNLNYATCNNNIAVGCGTLDFSFGANMIANDYNASSDATATGDNSITTASATDFVSGTDLHLAAGADEIDIGNNVGSPYDYDLDNVQVTGTWDIGADEYVAAGTTVTPYGYLSTNKGFW